MSVAVSGKSRRYNRPPDEQLGEMSFPGYDAEDEHFLPVSSSFSRLDTVKSVDMSPWYPF
jgi:hypothetical protein